MELDWGDGFYEETGAALLPSAATLIRHAAITPGERVIDIGCGTGNVALAAARAGAVVTAVDPAPRLVSVTRERAEAEGLEIETVLGAVASLDVPDASFDAALASFSIIFAPDPAEAVAGALRVLRPGGRAVISAWIPRGGISECSKVLLEGMGINGDGPWQHADSIRQLFEPHDVTVSITEESLRFEAESAEAWLASQETHHPFWRLARAWFAHNVPHAYEGTRERALAALAGGKSPDEPMIVDSPYNVIHVEVS